MPKFQVLTPIEHDHRLYVPKGALAPHHVPSVDADGHVTGYTAPSGGNGQAIPVDRAGAIDLPALVAAPLRACGAIGDEVKEIRSADPAVGTAAGKSKKPQA